MGLTCKSDGGVVVGIGEVIGGQDGEALLRTEGIVSAELQGKHV